MTTIREHNGKQAMHYCMPDDPALSKLIRQNLIRKHEAILGRAPHDDTLSFAFDKTYINRRQGRVTRLIDYKGIKIRGVLCPVPCYWQSGVNPDRLRVRFWGQKTAQVSAWWKSKYRIFNVQYPRWYRELERTYTRTVSDLKVWKGLVEVRPSFRFFHSWLSSIIALCVSPELITEY